MGIARFLLGYEWESSDSSVVVTVYSYFVITEG